MVRSGTAHSEYSRARIPTLAKRRRSMPATSDAMTASPRIASRKSGGIGASIRAAARAIASSSIRQQPERRAAAAIAGNSESAHARRAAAKSQTQARVIQPCLVACTARNGTSWSGARVFIVGAVEGDRYRSLPDVGGGRSVGEIIEVQLPMQIDRPRTIGPDELVLASARDRNLGMLAVEGERPVAGLDQDLGRARRRRRPHQQIEIVELPQAQRRPMTAVRAPDL